MSPEMRTFIRGAVLALPWVLIPFMYGCFFVCGRYFGPQLGYFVGFLIYWILWCGVIPLVLLGKQRLLQLFIPSGRSPRGQAFWSHVSWLHAVLLLIPPLLAFAFGPFRTLLSSVTPVVAVLSIGIAVLNGTAEEVLWRGLYAAVFPERWDLGVAYPTVAFSLWHVAPQILHPPSIGRGPFLLSALLIGLCWGLVAWGTGTVFGTIVSHVVLDASGFGALVYLR